MPALVAIWFLLASICLPITTDEAYYFEWTRHLNWGYLDHPPGVAWIASYTSFPRLGALLCAVLCATVLIRLYKAAGLKASRLEVATTFLLFNFAFLTIGVITTPDSILALCWALALHETFFALKQPVRWLSVGLWVGLGLLSKYTMVLFFPILLWVIIRERPNALKTKWPWLGFAVAILTFTPNLIWNAQNDWISFRFQWNHGFSQERPALTSHHTTYLQYPHAQTGDETSRTQLHIPLEPWEENQTLSRTEFESSDHMNQVCESEEEPTSITHHLDDKNTQNMCTTADSMASTPPPEKSWQTIVQSYLKAQNENPLYNIAHRLWLYIQGQLGFWGALLICLFFFSKKHKTRLKHPILFQTAFWLPLLFFGAISLKGHVEPNWPAMAILSAPALIAARWHISSKALRFGVINLAIMFIALAHTHHPLQTRGDRLLKETFGFKQLAQLTDKIDEPVFADKYQLVAMLNQYRHQPDVAQWPGMTRYSHFLLQKALKKPEHFTLVTTDKNPPYIPGYSAYKAQKVRNCIEKWEVVDKDHPHQTHCRPIHIWYVLKYRTQKPTVS